MPTTDSADKRNRQNQRRRKRNQNRKSRIRTVARKFEAALEDGNIEDAQSLMGQVESEWDRAASKGVIPKNRASRKISRLKKRLSKAVNEQ